MVSYILKNTSYGSTNSMKFATDYIVDDDIESNNENITKRTKVLNFLINNTNCSVHLDNMENDKLNKEPIYIKLNMDDIISKIKSYITNNYLEHEFLFHIDETLSELFDIPVDTNFLLTSLDDMIRQYFEILFMPSTIEEIINNDEVLLKTNKIMTFLSENTNYNPRLFPSAIDSLLRESIYINLTIYTLTLNIETYIINNNLAKGSLFTIDTLLADLLNIKLGYKKNILGLHRIIWFHFGDEFEGMSKVGYCLNFCDNFGLLLILGLIAFIIYAGITYYIT